MAEEVTLETLAKAYINIRTSIQDMEEDHKAQLEGLKDQFKQVSDGLLSMCNAQNIFSVKTAEGTVTRKVTSRYFTSDWDSMHTFIKEHDAMELLQNRLHDGNMKLFLEENPDLLPAGLQSNSKYAVSVRKPTKS